MWCEIYNLGVDAVHELGKTGLAVGSLVLVDNMLGGSHVETLGDVLRQPGPSRRRPRRRRTGRAWSAS